MVITNQQQQGAPSGTARTPFQFNSGDPFNANRRTGGFLQGGSVGAPTANDAGHAAFQRQVLGPLSDVFPQGNIRIGQIPAIEAGLNFQQRQLGLENFARGEEQLRRTAGSVGQGPSQLLQNEMATAMAMGQGPLAEEIRLAGQVQLRNNARDLGQTFGRRGISGGVESVAQQELMRDSQLATAGALNDLRLQGLDRLAAQASLEEERRIALESQLAEQIFGLELAPIDLSGLAVVPDHSDLPIAHDSRGGIEQGGGVAGDPFSTTFDDATGEIGRRLQAALADQGVLPGIMSRAERAQADQRLFDLQEVASLIFGGA